MSLLAHAAQLTGIPAGPIVAMAGSRGTGTAAGLYAQETRLARRGQVESAESLPWAHGPTHGSASHLGDGITGEAAEEVGLYILARLRAQPYSSWCPRLSRQGPF
jgi:hypothetical protein